MSSNEIDLLYKKLADRNSEIATLTAEVERLREREAALVGAVNESSVALTLVGNELCCYPDHSVSVMATVELAKRRCVGLLTPNPADTTAEEQVCGNCKSYQRCGWLATQKGKLVACIFSPSKWTPKDQEGLTNE